MHEMGIAMEMINIAISSIPEDIENPQVEKVNVKIGKLSTVVPDSLHFCFDTAIKETILDGAVLTIQEVPVVVSCNDCKAEWEISEPVFSCEKCKSGSVEIISGQELEMISIELKD